jgi:hypothetical protein
MYDCSLSERVNEIGSDETHPRDNVCGGPVLHSLDIDGSRGEFSEDCGDDEHAHRLEGRGECKYISVEVGFKGTTPTCRRTERVGI